MNIAALVGFVLELVKDTPDIVKALEDAFAQHKAANPDPQSLAAKIASDTALLAAQLKGK